MAIALYSDTEGAQNNNVSVDASSGANRVIVAVLCAGSTQDVTGITWNGEAFTRAAFITNAVTSRYNSVWYLVNPTGTGTQTCTWSGSLTDGMGSWQILVYTGAGGVANGTTNTTSSSTTFSIPVTANDGDWIVGCGQNNAGNTTYGANTTARMGASSVFAADSNGASSPTALNFSVSPAGNWGGVAAAVTLAPEVRTIDVNDAISITESVTMQVTSFINLFDSITISESRTVDFIFAVSVSDNLSITESVTVQNTQLGPINVNEAISITESITIQNTTLGGISVNDSISITESTSAFHLSLISVSDDLSISESVSLTNQLGNISVNDAISITESVTVFVPDQRFGLAKMRGNDDIYPLGMDDNTIL